MKPTLGKRTLGIAAPLAGVLALSACGTADIDQARTIGDTTSNGFAGYLARDYRDLAMFEADQMYDWPDAAHFARKANVAAKGEVPAPEDLGNWSIPQERQGELKQARQRLDAALNRNAIQAHPDLAATAQTKYDCWVEQAEEDWQYDHIASCRDEFNLAMQALEQPVAQTPPPVLVFFDWDQSNLETEAVPIIDQMAQQLRNGTGPIVIEGHADTSGPADYNVRLSERRAETIAGALSQRGVERDRMRLVAKGERDLRVPTADGVREPQNRRVRIEAGRDAMASR